MAIHYVRITMIKRSQGHSAVRSAAYRSGERLTGKLKDGQEREYDYTKKRGIIHSEIMLPDVAPKKMKDRGELWRCAEAKEGQWNSQLAREITIALPKELNKEAHIELVRDYCKEAFTEKKMAVDYAIHVTEKGNPHAHIMLSTREVTADGFADKKNRDWNKQKFAEDNIHKKWAEHTNKSLERHGRSERIDYRNYQERGLEKEASKHIVNPKLRKTVNENIKENNIIKELKREQEPRQELKREQVPRQELKREQEPRQELKREQVPRQELKREQVPRQELKREQEPRQELTAKENFARVRKVRGQKKQEQEREQEQEQEQKLTAREKFAEAREREHQAGMKKRGIEKINRAEIKDIRRRSRIAISKEKGREYFKKARARAKEARERDGRER